jgi:hypothetical protein
MLLTAEQRRAKLRTLMKHEGYASVVELMKAIVTDTVSPAICCNEDCNYTAEMEPDQEGGWCDECRANTMQSALILAGLI